MESSSCCSECGAVLSRAGEYHPYAFCVLKKAGLDPWGTVRRINADIGIAPHMSHVPPLIKHIPGRTRESARV